MKGDFWFFLLNEELETQEFSRNNLTKKQVQKGFGEQLGFPRNGCYFFSQ